MSENMNTKAIDTLLEKGMGGKLRVRILGVRFSISMKIRPLYLGTILLLSKEQEKIRQAEEGQDIIWQMFEKSENIKVFARCAAIAVLNNRTKIRLFSWILSRLILNNATIKDIHTLMTIVISQMNARDFFFTTALIGGLKVVERNPQQNMSQNEQSGDQSENSAKS